MPRNIKVWFARLTLAHKLTTISMATTAAALMLVCGVFVVYDISTSRQRLVDDLGMLGDVVAKNSAAALAFTDAKAATDTLEGLRRNEHIVSALMISGGSGPLARFDRDAANASRTPVYPDDAASSGR